MRVKPVAVARGRLERRGDCGAVAATRRTEEGSMVSPGFEINTPGRVEGYNGI